MNSQLIFTSHSTGILNSLSPNQIIIASSDVKTKNCELNKLTCYDLSKNNINDLRHSFESDFFDNLPSSYSPSIIER